MRMKHKQEYVILYLDIQARTRFDENEKIWRKVRSNFDFISKSLSSGIVLFFFNVLFDTICPILFYLSWLLFRSREI